MKCNGRGHVKILDSMKGASLFRIKFLFQAMLSITGKDASYDEQKGAHKKSAKKAERGEIE